jgi:hypothetical protein
MVGGDLLVAFRSLDVVSNSGVAGGVIGAKAVDLGVRLSIWCISMTTRRLFAVRLVCGGVRLTVRLSTVGLLSFIPIWRLAVAAVFWLAKRTCPSLWSWLRMISTNTGTSDKVAGSLIFPCDVSGTSCTSCYRASNTFIAKVIHIVTLAN